MVAKATNAVTCSRLTPAHDSILLPPPSGEAVSLRIPSSTRDADLRVVSGAVTSCSGWRNVTSGVGGAVGGGSAGGGVCAIFRKLIWQNPPATLLIACALWVLPVLIQNFCLLTLYSISIANSINMNHFFASCDFFSSLNINGYIKIDEPAEGHRITYFAPVYINVSGSESEGG